MTLRLEATQNGSTWFAISEDATDQNSGSVQGSTTAGITAVGLYAGYRLNLVQIACGSGQTPAITATYSGTFNTTPTAIGAFYQSAPYRKIIFQNVPTTSAVSPITVNAPTGNAGGAIFVNCYTAATGANANCPTGMSITVIGYIAFGGTTGGGGGGNIIGAVSVFSIPTTANAFIFPVANGPAVSLTFTVGNTGSAGINWSAYYVASSNPPSQYVTDPCQSAGANKSSVAINVTTATTTVLVPLIAGARIYPCGLALSIAPSATSADTATIETGSGASCGTGTTALTGAFGAGNLTTSAPNLEVSLGELQATPASNAMCMLSAGTTVNIQGVLTYVQQ